MNPEAVPLVERAHFQPFFSERILRAQLHFIRRKPLTYLGTLWTALRATWGSPRFFAGVLDIFPRTVFFAQQMEADGITHVHAHFASHPAAAAFIIHRLTGIPYSFTAHGSDLHVDRHMLREKVAEAAFVVAISKYNKELIIAECGDQFREKILVIHCGVDAQAIHPARESGLYSRDANSEMPRLISFSRSVNPFTIFCIGLLQQVKGQTFLIEACRLLRERRIDFTCHFVGDGADRAALMKQVVESGLADCVYFRGWRTHEETIKLLRDAHVLALPSVPTRSGKREGIPIVLMEAMASGVPVVASGVSGIPELVEHECNGLLVPPGDPPALADALQRLHDSPALRQRLAQAGRDRVVQDFDLHTNAAILAQHFS
ncbi:MAG: glycosyltransferase [Chloroflexi bacterium]|nr:glycosyltransferase [Chloroflexota bacterium]